METTFANEYFELSGVRGTIGEQNVGELVQRESASALGRTVTFDGYVNLPRSSSKGPRPSLASQMMLRAASMSSLLSHPPPTSGYGTGGSVCFLSRGVNDECPVGIDPDPRNFWEFSPHQLRTMEAEVMSPTSDNMDDSPWPAAHQQGMTQMWTGACGLTSHVMSPTLTDESSIPYVVKGDMNILSPSDAGYFKVCWAYPSALSEMLIPCPCHCLSFLL